jgi:hypothetical protein
MYLLISHMPFYIMFYWVIMSFWKEIVTQMFSHTKFPIIALKHETKYILSAENDMVHVLLYVKFI